MFRSTATFLSEYPLASRLNTSSKSVGGAFGLCFLFAGVFVDLVVFFMPRVMRLFRLHVNSGFLEGFASVALIAARPSAKSCLCSHSRSFLGGGCCGLALRLSSDFCASKPRAEKPCQAQSYSPITFNELRTEKTYPDKVLFAAVIL